MRLSTLAIIVALVTAVATGASAQSSAPALPFRAGQWGGQFAIGSNVQSIGFLRFHSPSAAWVFDASASLNRITTDAGFGNPPQKATNNSVSVRVGPRGYAPVTSQVVRYLGAGLLAGVSSSNVDASGTSSSVRSWTGGAYAELGGDYLVTPHLAIGVQGTAQAAYARISASAQQDTHSNSWSIGLGTTRLVATIFF